MTKPSLGDRTSNHSVQPPARGGQWTERLIDLLLIAGLALLFAHLPEAVQRPVLMAVCLAVVLGVVATMRLPQPRRAGRRLTGVWLVLAGCSAVALMNAERYRMYHQVLRSKYLQTSSTAALDPFGSSGQREFSTSRDEGVSSFGQMGATADLMADLSAERLRVFRKQATLGFFARERLRGWGGQWVTLGKWVLVGECLLGGACAAIAYRFAVTPASSEADVA